MAIWLVRAARAAAWKSLEAMVARDCSRDSCHLLLIYLCLLQDWREDAERIYLSLQREREGGEERIEREGTQLRNLPFLKRAHHGNRQP